LICIADFIFNNEKYYTVSDYCIYYLTELWVYCHVLCQQWCSACWSWWNTESYSACFCTGDPSLAFV